MLTQGLRTSEHPRKDFFGNFTCTKHKLIHRLLVSVFLCLRLEKLEEVAVMVLSPEASLENLKIL
jgi:hypothetical protein